MTMLTVVFPMNADIRTTRYAYTIHNVIRREARVPYAGKTALIEWGVADTYFTCPAKVTLPDRTTRYGFITGGSPHNGGDDLTNIVFTETPNRPEAKQSYRTSIQF